MGTTGPASSLDLDASIAGLPGAGPATRARLAARGIETARDLLFRAPRAYDDLRSETPIAALGAVADGSVVLVRGTVVKVHVFPRRFLDVTLGTPAGPTLRARWFRAPGSMAKTYAKGTPVALAGPLRTAPDGTRELVHPTNVTAAPRLGLRARYTAIEGVGARVYERLVAAALGRARADVEEALPAEARARLGLPTLAEALRAVHAPPDQLAGDALQDLLAGRSAAHRRLALEELLVVQVAFLLRRAQSAGPAPVVSGDPDATIARLEAAVGFSLTAGQARAVREVARDMRAGVAMQRLLVGEVGSGKTAVAFAAAALAASAGGQTLMMVPTEVLAEQHARTLGPLAARLGMSMGVLTGATAAGAREALGAAFASGDLALLLGTHALLDPGLGAADLRLVIVDEQHRFGVAQRARLGRVRGAAGGPHLLVMSATPIPRTMALALHGDLDASVLDQRPGGRPLPATVVCAGADERQAAYHRLREAVGEGRQAFVVCPIRERTKRHGAVTAVAHYAALRKQLAPVRVGLLHGALASAEKEATLRAFAAGRLDVLVATTVVELGIDVPNATVMIVEDADRFGLAQLHQLRGRVGRGAAPGLCFLCAPADGGEARDRLSELAATADGFRLAEADLARRGFGDLFGTRQAGRGGLVAGDARETFALVQIARAEAEALLAADPALTAHAALARAARARAAAADVYAEDAG